MVGPLIMIFMINLAVFAPLIMIFMIFPVDNLWIVLGLIMNFMISKLDGQHHLPPYGSKLVAGAVA